MFQFHAPWKKIVTKEKNKLFSSRIADFHDFFSAIHFKFNILNSMGKRRKFNV
jgi:hypothetical protein